MLFCRALPLSLVLCACGVAFDGPDSGVFKNSAHDAGPAAVVMVDAGVVAVGLEADAGTEADAGGMGVFDAGVPLPDPVLFIHGINGSKDDWNTMISRLVADGWPADRLKAETFADPKWGCNSDNAEVIVRWANELMAATHTTRIDLVAHSMGSLSSRRYLKYLNGAAAVNTYVSLGGMNHGLSNSCWGATLGICVWKELCASGGFIKDLNAAPATAPPTTWVTIAGGADETVSNDSTFLVGAENIVVPGVTHDGANGLQQDPVVYENVARVLRYNGH